MVWDWVPEIASSELEKRGEDSLRRQSLAESISSGNFPENLRKSTRITHG